MSQGGAALTQDKPQANNTAPVDSLPGRVQRLFLFYAAWVILTVPTWLLLTGVGGVRDVLRMGIGFAVLTIFLTGGRFLGWPVDPLRLRRSLGSGLLVQVVAGPVILAMDPSGAMWLTILGLAAAHQAYAEPSSSREVAQLVVLFCVWVASRFLPSQGAAMAGVSVGDLKSFEPLALFWLTFVMTFFLFASIDLQSAPFFPDPEGFIKQGSSPLAWQKAGGCSVTAFSGAVAFLAYAGFLMRLGWWRAWAGAGAVALGVFFGIMTGDLAGSRLARSLTAGTLGRVGALFSLGDYLADRTKLLGAFVLGYAGLALWFGAAFQVLSRAQPDAFRGIPANASFDTFLYTSVITLGTVGYGDIVPATRGARILVMLEVFAGMIWSTVVFAGVVWYVGAERPKPPERQPATVGTDRKGCPATVGGPPEPSREVSLGGGTRAGALE